MRLFEQAVLGGQMEGETYEMFAYGLYLMHGGTYKGFMDLNDDEVQMMVTSYVGLQQNILNQLVKSIGKMLGAEEK